MSAFQSFNLANWTLTNIFDKHWLFHFSHQELLFFSNLHCRMILWRPRCNHSYFPQQVKTRLLHMTTRYSRALRFYQTPIRDAKYCAKKCYTYILQRLRTSQLRKPIQAANAQKNSVYRYCYGGYSTLSSCLEKTCLIYVVYSLVLVIRYSWSFKLS